MLMKKQHPRITMRLGLLCLVASSLFAYFAPRTGLASEAWVDGIHGFLMGAAIALLLLSAARRGGGSRT